MKPQHRASHRRLPLGLALAGLLAWRMAAAAPAQQAEAVCGWERLAAGEASAQHGLVPLPGTGLLSFGGAVDPASQQVTDTLRVFDQRSTARGAWRRLDAAGAGPGPRAQHSSVLRDAAGETALLAYGGVDLLPPGGTTTWQSPLGAGGLLPSAARQLPEGAFALHLETAPPRWELVGGEGGGPRADHAAVYDPRADAMIVFGGRSGEAAESRTDDLRRLRLGPEATWETLRLPDGPGARFAHVAIYDPRGQRMIVHGGTTDWTRPLDELWSLELDEGWDRARWRRLEAGGSAPRPRFDHAAVYLPQPGWMLIHGGSSDGLGALRDLAALDLTVDPPRWLELESLGPRPASLRGLAAAWSAESEQAVFQGGQAEGAIERLSWGLRCQPAGAPTWTPVPTALAPATPFPLHLPRLEAP